MAAQKIPDLRAQLKNAVDEPAATQKAKRKGSALPTCPFPAVQEEDADKENLRHVNYGLTTESNAALNVISDECRLSLHNTANVGDLMQGKASHLDLPPPLHPDGSKNENSRIEDTSTAGDETCGDWSEDLDKKGGDKNGSQNVGGHSRKKGGGMQQTAKTGNSKDKAHCESDVDGGEDGKANGRLKDVDVRWDTNYQAVVKYCEERNKLPSKKHKKLPPQSYEVTIDGTLLKVGKWLDRQKERFKGTGGRGALSESERGKLMDIDEFSEWARIDNLEIQKQDDETKNDTPASSLKDSNDECIYWTDVEADSAKTSKNPLADLQTSVAAQKIPDLRAQLKNAVDEPAATQKAKRKGSALPTCPFPAVQEEDADKENLRHVNYGLTTESNAALNVISDECRLSLHNTANVGDLMQGKASHLDLPPPLHPDGSKNENSRIEDTSTAGDETCGDWSEDLDKKGGDKNGSQNVGGHSRKKGGGMQQTAKTGNSKDKAHCESDVDGGEDGKANGRLKDVDQRWKDNYQAVVEYCKEHHGLPPQRHNGTTWKLGTWLTTQKKRVKGQGAWAALSESERDKLMDIDEFSEWDRNPLRDDDVRWEAKYLAVAEYCKEHEKLPSKDDKVTIDGTTLNVGNWLHEQKKRFKGTGKAAALSESELTKLMEITQFSEWARKLTKR